MRRVGSSSLALAFKLFLQIARHKYKSRGKAMHSLTPGWCFSHGNIFILSISSCSISVVVLAVYRVEIDFPSFHFCELLPWFSFRTFHSQFQLAASCSTIRALDGKQVREEKQGEGQWNEIPWASLKEIETNLLVFSACRAVKVAGSESF